MSDYEIKDDCRYTREDEWLRSENEHWKVGVTDYAQQQLGDVVFVELPQPGTEIKKGDAFGVVESVKAVSDLYAPLSGRVVSTNEALADAPEKVNEDCYGDGWMITIDATDDAELDDLLDAAGYRDYVASREE